MTSVFILFNDDFDAGTCERVFSSREKLIKYVRGLSDHHLHANLSLAEFEIDGDEIGVAETIGFVIMRERDHTFLDKPDKPYAGPTLDENGNWKQ